MRTMSNPFIARPATRRPHESLRFLTAFVFIVVVAAVLLAAIVPTLRPTSDTVMPGAPAVEDGWMSYLGAAAPPRHADVEDGWSSYLLRPELDPATVRDGWSSYLLVDELDPNTVLDGWMSRYGHDD